MREWRFVCLVAVLLVVLDVMVPTGVGAQDRGTTTFDGWRQATSGYSMEFPRDHGSHPDYRIEWWYYTGNLESADGRRYGYQVTFFRIGVDPTPENPSAWAVRDLFMAHLAVTDVDGGRQWVAERLERGGIGWAGARTGTLEVWNGDWQVELVEERHRLVAFDREFGVELSLDPGKPPVLHGEAGLSQKGETPGNASHYYSLTRMPTTGRLLIDGDEVEVFGTSWMDHEFGTSFLEPGQVGWDWFSLQLDDGSDVMLFQLRRNDGRAPRLAGTWVAPDGTTRIIRPGDIELADGRRWTSPASGAVYPVEWRLSLGDPSAELGVKPMLDAQELYTEESTGVTYWEGAVEVSGEVEGRPVRGLGYLEMTGYVGRPMSEFFR
jgi:predicted secreted hydrolase